MPGKTSFDKPISQYTHVTRKVIGRIFSHFSSLNCTLNFPGHRLTDGLLFNNFLFVNWQIVYAFFSVKASQRVIMYTITIAHYE